MTDFHYLQLKRDIMPINASLLKQIKENDASITSINLYNNCIGAAGAKGLAEALIGVFVITLFAIVILLFNIPSLVRQLRCKHEKFRETSACDAICCECGANLGFIGNLRKSKP